MAEVERLNALHPDDGPKRAEAKLDWLVRAHVQWGHALNRLVTELKGKIELVLAELETVKLQGRLTLVEIDREADQLGRELAELSQKIANSISDEERAEIQARFGKLSERLHALGKA